MAEHYIATSTITIDASPDRVWAVLTDPEAAREFMFGTTLEETGGATVLTLSQDNNATPEAAAHPKGMWDTLVAKVKEIAEPGPAAG